MFKKIVFHGTQKERIESIKQNGFNESLKKTEWLGNGVYFFEKDACAWSWILNPKNNKGKEPSVLAAEIKCQDYEFFDLCLGNNRKILESQVVDVLTKSPTDKGKPIIERAVLRCLACNTYCRQHHIKILTYKFPFTIYSIYGFPISVTRIRYFCVFDRNCISNVTELATKLEKKEGFQYV